MRSSPQRKHPRPASLRTSRGARSVLLRMAADQERADRIRALKQARPDLTWRRIADHVGVTERSAADWQTKGGIEYANAEKLAELLEVDVDYIWRGPADEDRAPSPFNGRDSLADQMAAFTEAIAKQNALLERQSEILERIERAISREDESRRGLLAAADEATRALRGGPRPRAAGRGKPAK